MFRLELKYKVQQTNKKGIICIPNLRLQQRRGKTQSIIQVHISKSSCSLFLELLSLIGETIYQETASQGEQEEKKAAREQKRVKPEEFCKWLQWEWKDPLGCFMAIRKYE